MTSEDVTSEEPCILPRCPECRQPMKIFFRGGDLSKPFFGHRKFPNDCGKYLDGVLCGKNEAIRYPSARPKTVEKPTPSMKSSKQSKSKKKEKVDPAWANNTLTKCFGEPPGLDPSWCGD